MRSELEAISGARGRVRAAILRLLRPIVLALGPLIAGMAIGQPAPAEGRFTEVERTLEARLAGARDALAAGRATIAVDELTAARDLVAELKDTARSAAVEGSLGQAFLLTGQAGAARAAFENALRLAQAAGLVELEAAAQNDLGSLALTEGEPEVALDRFERAFDLATGAGRPDTAAAAAIKCRPPAG